MLRQAGQYSPSRFLACHSNLLLGPLSNTQTPCRMSAFEMYAGTCVCAHTHACEIVGLFPHFLFHSCVRTLYMNIAQLKENRFLFSFFFFFFWSHRYVASVLSRVGRGVCLAAVLPVVYVKNSHLVRWVLGTGMSTFHQKLKVQDFAKVHKKQQLTEWMER